MKKTYHINPQTGVPSLCRAEKGNCPYGGQDGKENHFNSYTEAQIYSQKMFEEMYRILPIESVEDPRRLMQEIEGRKRFKAENAKKLPPPENEYKATKELMYTEDENFVMGVIEGEVYAADDWKYTSVALQNPKVSRKFITEALFDYPGEFNKTTRRWLALNRALSHKALVAIIENEDEDPGVRAVAFKNPKLDKTYVENIINNEIEKTDKLPYSMIHFTPYANKETQMYKNESTLLRLRDPKDIYEAEGYAREFKTWEQKYKEHIKDEQHESN